MAIRIIKPGRTDDNYKGKCSKCGCEIEFDKSDIVYEDRPCGDSYVSCPTCNSWIKPVKKNERKRRK